MLLPKKVKFRKQQRGTNKGIAVRGSYIAFGEFALKAVDRCLLTSRQIEAARKAISVFGIDASKIGALYVGSESHPYAVKPSSTVVSQALGLTNNLTTADTQFACKAGTASIQIIAAMVKSGMIKYGMAIGADTSQSKQGDVLEYSAAAGGAAFILGDNNNTDKNNKQESAADILYTTSYTTNTPDFWRRQTQSFPEHTGRFTGEPAYMHHTTTATTQLLESTGFKIQDFDHVIFHQPNRKFPLLAAKKLNVTNQQLRYGLLVNKIGNTYSGSSMLGLTNVLENAKPNGS